MAASLKVTDFSDREFLALCVEAMDADGWFSALEVIKDPALEGLNHRHVSNRCSWLWRYGVLEREHLTGEDGNLRYVSGDPGRPKWGQRWTLTPLGERLLGGHLTKRQEGSLERIEDERMLDLTRWFAQQLREAPDVARNLMLREWRYSTQHIKPVYLEKAGRKGS